MRYSFMEPTQKQRNKHHAKDIDFDLDDDPAKDPFLYLIKQMEEQKRHQSKDFIGLNKRI